MAIVYSYPLSTSILSSDMVVGTSTVTAGNGKKKNQTKNFSMGQIATFVIDQIGTTTLQEAAEAGATVIGVPIILESNDFTLQAQSENEVAIIGIGPEVAGVKGSTDNGYGVWGIAQAGHGGYFSADNGTGLTGISEYGIGVYGQSNESYGGYFSSGDTYSIVAAQSAAKPGGGSWTVYSDSRIKENIKPYEKGLSELLLVNPVNYEYNGLAGTEKGKEYTGIIAQEIKEIFPETVSTYRAKLNETDTEKTDLYDFNSSALTFALINAVKELNERIAILEGK